MPIRLASWTKSVADQHPILQTALQPAILARRSVLQHRDRRLRKRVLSPVIRGELTLKVESFDGTFTLNLQSALCWALWMHGQYEPELSRQVREHVPPELDAIDVGANAGLYTVLLSRLVSHESRILAIEPGPEALQLLRTNIEQNGVSHKTVIFPGAVSNHPGTSSLHIPVDKSEYASLRRPIHSGLSDHEQTKVEVDTTTLDTLISRYDLNPGFIKLDIEGAEHLALQGAPRLLEHHRPTILIESSDRLLGRFGSSTNDLLATFRQYEYRTVINANRPEAPIELAGNLLAIP